MAWAPLLLTAFATGFLGSTHCIAMCGGIVGMLNPTPPSGKDGRTRSAIWHKWFNVLSYNAGRLTSYTVIGALAGTLGMGMAQLDFSQNFPLAPIISGGFMVALGLYVAGWWRGLLQLERAGGALWRSIRPLGVALLPMNGPVSRFGLGLVWGWLPCGLVYSALALSMTTGTPLWGALFMLAFGLGTLPMLLAMFHTADGLRQLASHPGLRQIIGILIIAFGLWNLAAPLTGISHH